MKRAIQEILQNTDRLIKFTASSPFDKNSEFSKTTVRPISIKNEVCFQAERYKNNQVFHLNFDKSELSEYLLEIFTTYRQICVFFEGETVTFALNNAKKANRSIVKNNLKNSLGGNDRKKIIYLMRATISLYFAIWVSLLPTSR